MVQELDYLSRTGLIILLLLGKDLPFIQYLQHWPFKSCSHQWRDFMNTNFGMMHIIRGYNEPRAAYVINSRHYPIQAGDNMHPKSNNNDINPVYQNTLCGHIFYMANTRRIAIIIRLSIMPAIAVYVQSAWSSTVSSSILSTTQTVPFYSVFLPIGSLLFHMDWAQY